MSRKVGRQPQTPRSQAKGTVVTVAAAPPEVPTTESRRPKTVGGNHRPSRRTMLTNSIASPRPMMPRATTSQTKLWTWLNHSVPPPSRNAPKASQRAGPKRSPISPTGSCSAA